MALNVGQLYASFGIDTKGLDKQISSITKQCQNIGKGLTITGAAMTAALTVPITKAAKAVYTAGTNFEAQMSKVEAISGAEGDALDALTQKALKMGSTTAWTATEAGEALQYMAMAGWDTDSMLAGLEPIMNLATAAGENLGTTSDIVTDAMTAFGYTLESVGGDTDKFNDKVEHFADVLSAAATNSNTNVSMMGESFKYIAPLAGTLGYSVDDIAIALGTMANAGIKGSQAGTSLRSVIQNMIKPTNAQRKAMKRLGLSLYDSNGKTKSFAEVMGDMRQAAKDSGIDMGKLQEEVGKLDEQLANGEITQKQYDKAVKKLCKGNEQFLKDVTEISGARGLSGMLAIMNATDEEFDDLTKSIYGCDGATAKMAKTMLDNTKGKVTLFKSALEGLGITIWTQVAPAFDKIVESATAVIQGFTDMDSGTRGAILKMVLLAAAVGPVTTLLGGLTAAAGLVGPALIGMLSPMGMVGIGLGLFAAAAISENNDIGKAFEDMASKATEKLNELDSKLPETMQAISDKMPALADSVAKGLSELIPAVLTFGLDIIIGLANAISDNADKIAMVAKTVFTSFMSGLAARLPVLIPAAIAMIAKLGKGLVDNAPDILKSAGEVGLSILKGILDTDWIGLGDDIITAIGNAFKGIDENATGFAEKLGTIINDELTPEKISAFITNASSLAVKLIELISDGIRTGGHMASILITAIGEMIQNALDGDIIGDLTGFGMTIIKAIAAAIKKAIRAAAEVASALAELLSKIDWKQAAGDLITMCEKLVLTLAGELQGTDTSPLSTALGTMINAALRAVVGIASALIDAFTSPEIFEALYTIAGTLIEKLWGFIQDSIVNIFNWNEVMNYITQQREVPIETKIQPTFDLGNDQFDNQARAFWGEITQMIADGAEKADVEARIAEWGNEKIGKLILSKDQNFADSLNALIEEQYGEGNAPTITVPEPEVEVPFDAEEVSKQVRKELGLGEGGEGSEAIKADVPVEISADSVTVVDKNKGKGGIATATQEKIDQLIAKQHFKADVAVDTSVTVTVTDSNATVIGEAVGTAIKQGAAAGLVGGASMAFTAGQNFAKGYANGINSWISKVCEKAAQMVRDAIDAANAAQDSGSPSRVMKKVGNWYGEGYVEGIMNQIRYVKRAAGTMAESAVNGLTMRSNSAPALAIAGAANSRQSIDYDRLAEAVASRPAIMNLNGRKVAEYNADNTAIAQNSRSGDIQVRFGRRW